MEILTRPAGDEDKSAIEQLLDRCFLPSNEVADHLDNFIVATAQGTIIGCAGFEAYPPHVLLRSLAVAHEHRGSGIGGRLMEEIQQMARARGFREAFAVTTTIKDLLLSKGFNLIAKREAPEQILASPQLKGVCPDSAHLLSINLQAVTIP